MTREEFENLQIGDYIHDLKVGDEWQVLSYVGSALRCECTKASKTWGKGEITNLPIDVHSHFIVGRHPDNVTPTPEQPQQEFEFNEELLKSIWHQRNPCHDINSNSGKDMFWQCVFMVFKDYTESISTPQPYIPKHRELCAVVTKSGLTTECEVFESNGRLFAISLKDGKPDGVFSPEQIDKFLPLTK